MRTVLFALIIALSSTATFAKPRYDHYGYGYGAWYFTPGPAWHRDYVRGYVVTPQGYYYAPRVYGRAYFYDPGNVHYYPKYYHNWHNHR